MEIDQYGFTIVNELVNGEEDLIDTQMKIKPLNRFSLLKRLTLLVINFIIVTMIVVNNYRFTSIPRTCAFDSSIECFDQQLEPFFFQIFYQIFLYALPFAVGMFLSLINILYKQLFPAILIDLVILISYNHHEPSLYDFSYFFQRMMMVSVIGVFISLLIIYGVVKLGLILIMKKQKMFLFYVTGIIINIWLIKVWYVYQLSDTYRWQEGILGKTIKDISPDGKEYCSLIIPKKDYYNLLSGNLLDASYHFYDCTKLDFKDHVRQRRLLTHYIPQANNSKYLALPQLNELSKTLTRADTQEYLFENAKGYNHLTDIPDNIEYILDVENLKYIIDLKVNRSLIQERSKIRRKLEQDRVKNKVDRSLPKNIIVLYIDALSRVRLRQKLPKVFDWFSEQNQKKKEDHIFFQSMRGLSLASITYHSILAYFYGVQSETYMNLNSRYSLTKGYMDTTETTILNEQTGKNQTHREYQSPVGKNYQSIIQDFQQSGYITGMTNTDCAVSPLTQRGMIDSNYKPLKNDHMGVAPSCDPNYFLSQYGMSRAGGPYGIFRRCLYGRESIDYSIEYGKQFLTRYADQPKFFQIEMLEAHERSQEQIKYQDQKLYEYMNWLDKEGHLKDSVFLLLSDHGYHMYSIIYNYVSNEMMWGDTAFPIQIMLLPKTLLNKEDIINLQENEQKVTTMFEIHYFFKYLISSDKGQDSRRDSIVSDVIPVDRDSTSIPQSETLIQSCKRKKTSF